MLMNEKGFTLIEMLVVVLISVIVLIGLYQVLEQNQRIFNAQQQITTLDNEMRSTLETVIKSIRTAGSGKKALKGAPMIYRAEQNKLRLLTDLPKDVHGTTTWVDSTNPGPNGSSFDIADGPDADTTVGNGDDENENGDLILNDYDEDITFMLSPDPCAAPPCKLIKRENSDHDPYPLETGDAANGIPAVAVPTGAAAYPNETDEVLADNILSLTFAYYVDSTTVLDWKSGTNPPRLSNDDLLKVGLIRVTITGQSKVRDLATKRYHTMQLSADVDVRNH